MKRKILNAIGSIVVLSLGLMALPSRGQDLNAELKNAVCQQNWGEAIEIIDRMGAISPQSASRLQEYRDRLVTLQNSGAQVPGWDEDCQTSTSPASPSPPSSSAPPLVRPGGDAVLTLDRLKECQPYKSKPTVFLIEVIIDIQGWQGDRCAVQYLFANGDRYMDCRFQRDTLALMTDEKAYREARAMDTGSGEITFNSDNPRDGELSAAIEGDCQIDDSAFPEEAFSPDAVEDETNPVKQAYDRIENMSYQEVVALLGLPGREVRRDRIITWETAEGAIFEGEFQGDRLQGIFRYPGTDCQTQELGLSCKGREMPPQFERVDNGMTTAQVRQILGQPSKEQEKIVYKWELSHEGRNCAIEVGFVDDKSREKMYSCGG
ncbi:MAG: hypothetical protein AB4290_19165 [Spirulina sp.]